MLSYYNTILIEHTDEQSGARLLLGVGAIKVDAIRSGRHVEISDVTTSERILLDPRLGSTPTDRSVVPWQFSAGELQK